MDAKMEMKRQYATRLSVEPLEDRHMLAITSAFAAGVLTVESNDAAIDVVTIDDVNANNIIDVNGVDVAGATFAATSSIIYENAAGSGSDTVTIDPGNNDLEFDTIAVTMHAGSGGDTFTAVSVGIASVMLVGGAGADSFTGGAGDDTFVDSPGNDTYDGGAGLDTLLIRGTIAADAVDVLQQTPSATNADAYTLSVVNGPLAAPPAATTESIISTNPAVAPQDIGNRPTIERILIETLSGDDIIRVAHAEEYQDNNPINGEQPQTIAYEVDAGPPNASDRLLVQDLGVGNTVIHRVGADQRSGSVTVGTLAPVTYSNTEFVDVVPLEPLTGATGDDMMGRLVVFKNDPFEANNTFQSATFLGSDLSINVDPTIDPGGLASPFPVPGDVDFYQFVAQETGTLDFQLYFEPIGTLPNGLPGLPGSGELNATFFDNDANPIAGIGGSGALPINDASGAKIGERITIPVVRNQTYFVRVQGDSNTAINVYNFTSIVVSAPVPELVDLQAASDSGRNNTDNITNNTAPTFNIILDDDRIDEFANRNLAPDTTNDGKFFTNAILVNGAVTTANNTTDFTDGALVGAGTVPAAGQFITFLSGGNAFQTRMITAFNAATGAITVAPGFTVAPAVTDTYVVTAAAPTGIADYGVQVFNNGSPIGFAFYTGAAHLWNFTATAGTLNEGDFNHISAAVWINDGATPPVIGRHALSPALQVTLDTTAPPVSFGEAGVMDDGLHADSDTGVLADVDTINDRITGDSTPTVYGYAEADSIVQLYLDMDANGVIDIGADILLGQTVAQPYDGNLAFTTGNYEITSTVDLNDPTLILPTLGRDGLRSLLVTAQDVAGNPLPMDDTLTASDQLDIFLDTQGPQVDGVFVTDDREYDLFDPKPSVNGFTPLVDSIDIDFIDQPVRGEAAAVVASNANELQLAVAPAIGDKLGEVALPGNGSLSVGASAIPRDGSVYYLAVDNNANTIQIYDPPSDGDGDAVLVSTKTPDVTISNVAWDPTRNVLWAAHGDSVYTIDPGDLTVTESLTASFQFTTSVGGLDLIDGLAYDPFDDTLWLSPDVSTSVFEFGLGGANPLGQLLNTVTPKNSLGESDGQVSGVFVGTNNTLYIGRDGAAEIRRIDKTTGDFISQFATTSGRVEDLVCDPVHYAPYEAILAKDAYNGLYEAFLVESGTCALPGFDPTPSDFLYPAVNEEIATIAGHYQLV
ncbi:MAG: hypothetical protein KDA37_09270, partial [Planctomycetales bacterium]|nr:hypothetical protein [Planctomycetales bacterium]